MLTQTILRHYGSTRYDPSAFLPVMDIDWVKPGGGLWTSPIECYYGWKEWCKQEHFWTDEHLSEFFDVRFAGNVYVVNSSRDLFDMPGTTTAENWWYPSFRELMQRGYDAIQLTWAGQCSTRFSHPRNLYGWDCESVLVMNQSSITSYQP